MPHFRVQKIKKTTDQRDFWSKCGTLSSNQWSEHFSPYSGGFKPWSEIIDNFSVNKTFSPLFLVHLWLQSLSMIIANSDHRSEHGSPTSVPLPLRLPQRIAHSVPTASLPWEPDLGPPDADDGGTAPPAPQTGARPGCDSEHRANKWSLVLVKWSLIAYQISIRDFPRKPDSSETMYAQNRPPLGISWLLRKSTLLLRKTWISTFQPWTSLKTLIYCSNKHWPLSCYFVTSKT